MLQLGCVADHLPDGGEDDHLVGLPDPASAQSKVAAGELVMRLRGRLASAWDFNLRTSCARKRCCIGSALLRISAFPALDSGGTDMALVLLRVPISDDNKDFIEVEVDQREVAGVELAANSDDKPYAKYSLTAALSRALPIMRAAVQQFRSAAERPDEISIELGLKIGGETGIIFARGTTEATFRITMSWQREHELETSGPTAPVQHVTETQHAP